jgi:WD40 repeat protein
VQTFDAATGRRQHSLTLSVEEDGYVSAFQFSRDGRRLATATASIPSPRFPGERVPPRVIVWNADSGGRLLTFPVPTDYIDDLAFNPNDIQLALACNDTTVRLYDAVTGTALRTLRGHTAEVRAVAFSPDGTHLVSEDQSGAAKVWEVNRGQDFDTLPSHGGIAFGPTGTRLATARLGDLQPYPVEYDLASGRDKVALVGPKPPWTTRVAWSPDGKTFALATKPIGSPFKLTFGELFMGRPRRVSSAVELWGADNPTRLHAFPLPAEWGDIETLLFSPDGGRVAARFSSGRAVAWDVRVGKELFHTEGPDEAIAFSPDGQLLACGSSGSPRILFRDATSGREVRRYEMNGEVPAQGKPRVAGVAFSRDGHSFAAVTSVRFQGLSDRRRSGRLVVWDVDTGRELWSRPGGCDAVVFSPDGARLVTGSPERDTVVIWDASSGRQILTLHHPGSGAGGTLLEVVFSPDGARLAARGDGFGDGLRVWDATPLHETRGTDAAR